MRAFGWWLALVALEVIGCFMLALVSDRMGYPDAGAAFVRCAWTLAGVGAASVLALLWFRVVAGLGRFALSRTRTNRVVSHGADSRRTE